MEPIPAPSLLTDSAAAAGYRYVLPVLDRLGAAGHEAYLVGGAVRDLLLGRKAGDWDVSTSAPPESVLDLWPEAVATGLRHGTVTLPLPQGPVEITTFRSEGPYSDGRHPDWVRFHADLSEDLARRDFTVNAMAFDPRRAVLYDPEGGRGDLERRVLRTVGDADQRFREDALRPLRGIRLAAVLEFEITPDTLEAVGRARTGVAGVARERVRDEILKLMKAPRPSIGIELMRRTGLLESVIPELMEGVGVTQNRFHAHDVYTHCLETLDAAPAENARVRLAALLHDVGKPRTRRVVNGEGTFYNHQQVGAKMSDEILSRLRFSNAERAGVTHLVAQHMFHYTPEWSNAGVRRFIRTVGREHVEDLFALRRADDAGAGTGKNSEALLEELSRRIAMVVEREEALGIGDLQVTGREVMEAAGLESGPRVGQVLRALLDRVLEDPSRNQKEILLKLAGEIRRSLDRTDSPS